MASNSNASATDNKLGDEAIIFLHLPKSAGTTLNRLIEWEYPLSKMYSVDPVLYRWSAAHLWKLPPKRLAKIKMFKGHMLFGLHRVLPQPATYITVLRDPIDRVISAFHFMRSYKLHPRYWQMRRDHWTLDDFVRRSPLDNMQCKVIAGAPVDVPCTANVLEKAQEHLARHFSVIGLSERFEESLALMKLRFGWKLASYSSFNVTRSRPKKRDLAAATLDLINERNSFDVALYETAKEIFEQAVQQNATEVSRIAAELNARRERANRSLGSTVFATRSAIRKMINRVYSAV